MADWKQETMWGKTISGSKCVSLDAAETEVAAKDTFLLYCPLSISLMTPFTKATRSAGPRKYVCSARPPDSALFLQITAYDRVRKKTHIGLTNDKTNPHQRNLKFGAFGATQNTTTFRQFVHQKRKNGQDVLTAARGPSASWSRRQEGAGISPGSSSKSLRLKGGNTCQKEHKTSSANKQLLILILHYFSLIRFSQIMFLVSSHGKTNKSIHQAKRECAYCSSRSIKLSRWVCAALTGDNRYTWTQRNSAG